MQLRPYQKSAIFNIKKAFHEGVNKQVIVLATGLGKTVIFSHLIKQAIESRKKRALVIAHREELLTQAQDKILAVEPTLRVGIEQGANYAYDDCDVIIASVPTLGRADSQRIQRLNPHDFCLIVTDEAHHASAETYKRIFGHFGVLKEDNDINPNILLLGVTATPSRNDNQGIDQIFDQVTFDYGVVQAMKDGWLSRIRAFRVNTDTDLTGIKTTAGDFNVGELADTVNNEERNKLVVKTYLEKAMGKQALCFAADVAHTQALCAEFNKQGVQASFVTGDTPKEERRDRLQSFQEKKLQVMVNAMVLTEGYDNPSIEYVLMARPTKSGILFQQMIGRGTRLYDGKENLTIIDFVDNTYKQKLQTTASLLGLDGAFDFKGTDILETKDKIDELLDIAPQTDLNKLDIDRIQYVMEEVDLLSGLKIPDELEGITSYDWHRYGDEGQYRLGLGNNQYIIVTPTLTGQFTIVDKKPQMEVKVGIYATQKDAIMAADDYVSVQHPSQVVLVNNNASWRKKDMSDSQKNLLKKLGVSDIVIEQLNKGQASRLITKLLSYSKRKRKQIVAA